MEDGEVSSVDKSVVQLWRVWRTVHEMVADRGYELSEEEVDITLNQFSAKFVNDDNSINRGLLRFSARPSEAMLLRHTPVPTESKPNPTPTCGPVYIEFVFVTESVSASLGVGPLRTFTKHLNDNGFHSGIVVSNAPLGSGAKAEIIAVEAHLRVECFHDEYLLTNITHHELVPRHVPLSPEEKIALLRRYRLKETQLPRILQKDSVAKYYGFTRGQVIKILRYSETAGRYASYRLCV